MEDDLAEPDSEPPLYRFLILIPIIILFFFFPGKTLAIIVVIYVTHVGYTEDKKRQLARDKRRQKGRHES
jgi:hypothetical protein